MKKQLASVLLAALLVLSCFAGLAVPAAAETVTEDLFELTQSRNMAIRVDYDTAPPTVSFLSPSGDAYDESAVADGKMTTADTGEALFFYIPNAEAGTWQIVYDKGANAELSFTWGPYAEAATINELTYTVEGDRLNANFLVSYVDDSYFSYTFSAVILDENGNAVGKKELGTGSARAGEMQEARLWLDGLNTYDAYHLMMEITLDSGGIDVFDSKITPDAFAYTNDDTPAAMEGFDVEVGVSASYLRVDWTETRLYGADAYILAVYRNDEAEPFYYEKLDSSVYVEEIAADHTAASKYRVELRYQDWSLVSEPAVMEIDLSMKDLLTIPTEEVTNKAQIKVQYDFSDFSDPVRTILTLNGTAEELLPTGEGFFTMDLEEYRNDISVLWYASEDLAFCVSGSIHADFKAPSLHLYEVTSDRVRTEKSEYILVGTTSAGATLTVGETTVTVGEDGAFSVTLPLENGDNAFTVTATSPSGNTAEQSFTVERISAVVAFDDADGDGKTSPILAFLPLILSVIGTAILSVFVVLSVRRFARQKREKSVYLAIKTLVSNVFFLAAFVLAVIAGFAAWDWIAQNKALLSPEFYEMAEQSISAAHAAIEARDAAFFRTVLFGAIAVGALLFGIVARLLPKTIGKKKAAPPMDTAE